LATAATGDHQHTPQVRPSLSETERLDWLYITSSGCVARCSSSQTHAIPLF